MLRNPRYLHRTKPASTVCIGRGGQGFFVGESSAVLVAGDRKQCSWAAVYTMGLELGESSSPGVKNGEIMAMLNPGASSSKTALIA